MPDALAPDRLEAQLQLLRADGALLVLDVTPDLRKKSLSITMYRTFFHAHALLIHFRICYFYW